MSISSINKFWHSVVSHYNCVMCSRPPHNVIAIPVSVLFVWELDMVSNIWIVFLIHIHNCEFLDRGERNNDVRRIHVITDMFWCLLLLKFATRQDIFYLRRRDKFDYYLQRLCHNLISWLICVLFVIFPIETEAINTPYKEWNENVGTR